MIRSEPIQGLDIPAPEVATSNKQNSLHDTSANLIIGDSLLARDQKEKKRPWIRFSKLFPACQINCFFSRTSKYLSSYRLSKVYNNVIIQLGVVDSAPRVMAWTAKADKNRGTLFLPHLPTNKKLFAACGLKQPVTLQTYRAFCRNNRQKALMAQYRISKGHISYFSPQQYIDHIEAFRRRNNKMMNYLCVLSILPPHSKVEKTRGYRITPHINKYNDIAREYTSRHPNVLYLDLIASTRKLSLRTDSLLQLSKEDGSMDDGYHILNRMNPVFAKVFDHAYHEAIARKKCE